MKILIKENEIQQRISEMASEIDFYYQCEKRVFSHTSEPVVVIGILKGVFFFMADLIRQLQIPIQLDFIKTQTYPGKSTKAQEPRMLMSPSINLHDRHVLLLDDILDEGKTLDTVIEHIRIPHPESVTVAVLLNKNKTDFPVISGFNIPDKFVVGYGLNYGDKYRELPYIAELEEKDEY